LKKENIQLSFDGKLWIKGRRQKTDTEYNIPLLRVNTLEAKAEFTKVNEHFADGA
jgi:hypothetical protein